MENALVLYLWSGIKPARLGPEAGQVVMIRLDSDLSRPGGCFNISTVRLGDDGPSD